jgi:hypothetical protein
VSQPHGEVLLGEIYFQKIEGKTQKEEEKNADQSPWLIKAHHLLKNTYLLNNALLNFTLNVRLMFSFVATKKRQLKSMFEMVL